MISLPPAIIRFNRSDIPPSFTQVKSVRRGSAAFSILEMLVVTAVIGIMAAIATMFLANYHRDVLLQARNQRNAQEIMALAMGATAVGADVVVVNDSETTIMNLIEGRNAKHGPFAGKMFQLSYMSPEEIQGAKKYLNWQHGMITYHSH